MYIIKFAPDGKNFFSIVKNKDAVKIWNMFNSDMDIAMMKVLNKFSRFRLINLETNKIVGER